MNTPSKEALEAAEKTQDYLGFPRRATNDLAAIIDRHFEPLRRQVAALRADNAELQKQEAESRRLFYAEQDKRQSAEFRCEELAGALKRALAQFAAMPEAKPHNDRDGVWHLWTDGCNILRAALASHDAGEPVAKYSFIAEPAKHPDTERIDWLESKPSKYNWGVTLDHGCVFAVRNTTSGYSTLREAIDAARKP